LINDLTEFNQVWRETQIPTKSIRYIIFMRQTFRLFASFIVLLLPASAAAFENEISAVLGGTWSAGRKPSFAKVVEAEINKNAFRKKLAAASSANLKSAEAPIVKIVFRQWTPPEEHGGSLSIVLKNPNNKLSTEDFGRLSDRIVIYTKQRFLGESAREAEESAFGHSALWKGAAGRGGRN
jgi:hypothetical protein